MLATLIQRYNKKSFHFKNDLLKFYRLSDATFYYLINTIYQFIKPYLEIKCLFLREMEPLINVIFAPKHVVGTQKKKC